MEIFYLKGTTVIQPQKPPIAGSDNALKAISNDEHKSVNPPPTAPRRRRSVSVC